MGLPLPQVSALKMMGAEGFSAPAITGDRMHWQPHGSDISPLSSINAGLALKHEERFEGAAFWDGSRMCREP